VPPTQLDEVLARLAGLGVTDDPAARTLIGRDGQGRVMWERTPVDLFFAYDAFHEAAAAARRVVPFADGTIPILAPEHLVVCKVVFDRAKDWVDIDAILADGTAVDAAEVVRWVGRVTGDTDPRFARIVGVLTGSSTGRRADDVEHGSVAREVTPYDDPT
jgi:hypothetical protein